MIASLCPGENCNPSGQTALRSPTADLLKGTAILLMIQVHLMALFAQQGVMDSRAGRLSLFLGGPPTAPVFMLIMGYFTGASNRSTAGLALRGVKLIALGGMLNLGMNAHLLVKIAQGAIVLDPVRYILGVDILFVAGVATILLAVLRPLARRSAAATAGVAFLVASLSPWVTSALTTKSPACWAMAYVGGNYWWSYFPWFPWLAYPLLGLAWHEAEARMRGASGDASLMHRWRLPAGALLVACAVTTGATWRYAVAVCSDLPRYYHHDLRFLLWTVAFLAVWFCLHGLCEWWWGNTPPLLWLKALGRNVTLCYILQWLLIGNIATALYKSESLLHWGLWVVVMVTATSLLSSLLRSRNPFRAGLALR
jgi:uncharacterized membrane protein